MAGLEARYPRYLDTSPEYFQEYLPGETQATKDYMAWLESQGLARRDEVPDPTGPLVPRSPGLRKNWIGEAEAENIRAGKRKAAAEWDAGLAQIRAGAAEEYRKGIRGGPERQKLWARQRGLRKFSPSTHQLKRQSDYEDRVRHAREYADTVAGDFGYTSGRQLVDNVTYEQLGQLKRLPTVEEQQKLRDQVSDRIKVLKDKRQKVWLGGDVRRTKYFSGELEEAKKRLRFLQARVGEAHKRREFIRYLESGSAQPETPLR